MENICGNCNHFNPRTRECAPVRNMEAARQTVAIRGIYPPGINPGVTEDHRCDAYEVETRTLPTGIIEITFLKTLMFTPRS